MSTSCWHAFLRVESDQGADAAQPPRRVASAPRVHGQALEEAETRFGEGAQQISEMGSPVDVSKLASVLGATRESGDLASRIKVAESEIREAQAAIQRQLRVPEAGSL